MFPVLCETLVSIGREFCCDYNWLLLGDFNQNNAFNQILSVSEIQLIEMFKEFESAEPTEILEIRSLK